MDNTDRQDTQSLTVDRDSCINVVVNRPFGNEIMEIDLRRIFYNMKIQRRVYAWVILLCLLVGLCAPLLLRQFFPKQLTVTSVVTLKYDVLQPDDEKGKSVSLAPVSDLTAPDGQPLDLNQITASNVLQAALDGITLSYPMALTELRDNIRIDRILSDESRLQQEAISRMLEGENAEVYDQIKDIELTYTNSFVVSLTNGFGKKKVQLSDEELRLVLDRVLAAYSDYFVSLYADLRLPDDEISVIELDTLEIQESLDLLRTAVQNLYAFCNSKPDSVKKYRSWRTGRSLENLMAELETVRIADVDYLYAYVHANNVAQDRDALIKLYQYQLRSAQARLDSINKSINANQAVLSSYKNDEIFISMQETGITKSTKTTTDYYNNLFLEQMDNYAKASELKARILDLTDNLDKLEAAEADGFDSAQYESMANELSYVAGVCRDAYDQIRDQFEEITTSSFFTTYVDRSAAQGKTPFILVANAKWLVIGGIGGLFIGFGLWFLSGLVPEFTFHGKEYVLRKEVAE